MSQLMPNYRAWRMLDGQTMAGEVLRPDHFQPDRLVSVRRVDGTQLTIALADSWPATLADVESAIAFYSTPGPMWQSLAERKRACGRS